MSIKSSKYNPNNIDKLPNNKPVLYRIETSGGNTNYIGTAKKGRVNSRLKEHLGEIPGAKVRIEQFSSIREAQRKEQRAIKRSKPKYNKQGI